jgi:hypothetical protein
VADYHTYHVGDCGILVHNAKFYKNDRYHEEGFRTDRIGRSRGDAPRSNAAQNEAFDHVASELGLDKDQRRRLHDEIAKQGYGTDEVGQIALDMFGR